MKQDRKEKGNFPILRFPEFQGEWEVKKLGEICKFVRGPFGSALKKEFFVKDGYAVYEQSHAIHNNFNSFRYYISEEKFNSLRRFSVEPKDIIMSCSGTMGKFAIIPEESKKGVINQALLKLTPKENFNHKFIKIALELPRIQNKLLSQSAGGAIKNVVGIPQLKGIGLYIPKPIEQNKISTFFSLLDQRIQTQIKIIEDLRLLKSAVSKNIFLRQCRFNDDCGEHYSDWENMRLGEVLVSVATKRFQIKSSEFNTIGLYKVIDQGQELIAGYSDKEECVFLYVPIIIFGDHTTIVKYIDFPFIVGADGTKLLKNRNNDNLKYLYYNLQHNNVQQEGYKRHFTTLSEVYLQIPCLEEQNKIVNFLSSIDAKIDTEKQFLNKLENQKQYLLQQMFI